MAQPARLSETLAQRAVDRAVGDRRAGYEAEMQRIMATTYRLIEQREDVDPSLRDILRETGLSTQAFYRYFQSKDELMLLLLDDGRRQLRSYLDHRMQRARSDDGRVREWIAGVLAQASQPEAAARTRPFFTNEARLVAAFPAEHQASVDLLLEPLISAVGNAQHAQAIYDLAFAVLRRHLINRTAPSSAEVDHVVRFSLRGAGREPVRGGARS